MNIKKYLQCAIIATFAVSITACAKPNYPYSSKTPDTTTPGTTTQDNSTNPGTSSITDTPNEQNPTTPTMPKNETTQNTTPAETPGNINVQQGTTPNTVEVPKSSSPQNSAGTAPNASPNSYMPASTTGISGIPVNTNYTFLSAVENEVLTLCNNERKKAGAPALTMDSKLRDIARYKAMEMLQYNYFNHISPVTKKSPFDLASSFGYSYSAFGENIQSSQGRTSASVTAGYLVSNWMNSEGHRANILNPTFKRMGIGVVFSNTNNKAYESQMFSN